MKNNMLLKVLAAMALAVIAGILTGTTATIAGVPFFEIYSLIGDLFLNALKLIMVPLVVSSIIIGTARMGAEHSFASIGKKTFGYYALTNLSAILIGWLLVVLIQPGFHQAVDLGNTVALPQAGGAFAQFKTILMRIIPANIIDAAAKGEMLSLILFSLVFGYFINKIESGFAATMLSFWQGVFHVMMNITHLIMKALPLGVFGLVAKVAASTGLEAVTKAGYFFVTVVLGLIIFGFIVLPLYLKFIAGVNPFKHIRNMTPALITAFSTSSSAATLPVTMECLEKKSGISNRICSFVVPLGTSVNLAGSAMQALIAVLFIAQTQGLHLPLSTQIIAVLSTFIISFGMAGIPSASILAIIIVLDILGIPSKDGLGLIMAVERILDMGRTTVNVFTGSSTAVLVARSEKETTLL